MKLYSSFSNIMNFRRSGLDICALYKRYALLYDQVIFNRHGCPIGDFPGASDVPEYIANFIVTKSIGDNFQLGKNKKFKDIFIDMWDVVENSEQFHKDAMSYVSDIDSKKIANFSWGRDAIDKEMGIHNDHREYVAPVVISTDIRSDLGFNFLLNDKLDSFKINFAPVVGEAINSSVGNEPTSLLFSTDIVIPNFEDLTWDQILELREDSHIKAFRNRAFSYKNDGESIDELIDKDLIDSLWTIAEEHKPNMKKIVIEAVMSFIPIPTAVNPLSILSTVEAVHQCNKMSDKHSWVYFIHNAKKANKSSNLTGEKDSPSS